MSVIGITMVKDEVDIIEHTLNHMIRQVDHVIVADNMSSDGTSEILAGFGDRITLIQDLEPGYYQSRKMTALAMNALGMGAKWVVPFDADEIWYSDTHQSVRAHLMDVPAMVRVVPADWYNHVVTIHDDPNEENPVLRMRWRGRYPAEMGKVAARTSPELVIEQGNHKVRYGSPYSTWSDHLAIRHFPYRSPEQFVKKNSNGLRAYELAADLPSGYGSHWKYDGGLIVEGGEEAGYKKFMERVYTVDFSEVIEDPAPIVETDAV